MGFPRRWKDILSEEQSKVPRGSGFGAYKEATKRASARYHRRSNPGGLLKYALYGGLAYVAYNTFIKNKV